MSQFNVPLRFPDTHGPQTRAAQGGGSSQGLNWGGFNNFLEGQTRRGTPFETQMLKDGASGFGSQIGGAMGAIGGQLNANAERVGQRRQQSDQWATSQGVLPPSMVESQLGGVSNPFQTWLNLNKQFQQGRAQTGVDAQQTQDQYANSSEGRASFNNRFAQQKQQADLMANLFAKIVGSGGSGGGFKTNFGAAGSY